MARTSVILDAGALAAYLDPHEQHHRWAILQAKELPRPFVICEAALSESFYLLEPRYKQTIIEIMRRGELYIDFSLVNEFQPVFALMEKYANVPMSLADACLVRMTEILSDPVVLTTDSDFRIYRRHGRHVVPCITP